MYCVYEHGKDEHGGYHVSPCGEGWCDTFKKAASLAEAWNGAPTEEGWEWMRYYPIWVHTRTDKLTDKIGDLTTALATKTAELMECELALKRMTTSRDWNFAANKRRKARADKAKARIAEVEDENSRLKSWIKKYVKSGEEAIISLGLKP
jgi:hypothetical protein